MKKFQCTRCGEGFENKSILARHWNKKIPCDFACQQCGTQPLSLSSYRKHIETECKYVPKNANKPIDLNIKTKSKNSKKKQNPKTLEDHDINELIEIYGGDVDIIRYCGENDWTGVDYEKQFRCICTRVVDRLQTSVHSESKWVNTIAVKNVFWHVFNKFYGNEEAPEFMYIYLENEKDKYMKVFDGEKYVQDDMKKGPRLIMMCQSVGHIIKKMITIDDYYSQDALDNLREKITFSMRNNFDDHTSHDLQFLFTNMYKMLVSNRDKIKSRLIQMIENKEQN